MASTPAEDAPMAITRKGFWHLPDPIIGKRVDEIKEGGYRFKTVAGLDFCKVNVLDDPRIRNTIEHFFKWSALGMYKAFGPGKYHYCILNRVGPVVHGLRVQLWSSESQLVFLEGSHLCCLNAEAAPNGSLAIPDDCLKQPGISEVPIDMANGGFAILDGRLGCRILRGRVIEFGFFTEDEIKFWTKIPLLKSPPLIVKVKEMESKTIGMNFEFVESKPESANKLPASGA